jgi:hypothetical protein
MFNPLNNSTNGICKAIKFYGIVKGVASADEYAYRR